VSSHSGARGLSSRGRQALDRFFAPQPQQAMVVARVGLGLMIFFSNLTKFPYVQQLFGPNGLGGYATMQRLPGTDPGRPFESAFQFLHYIPSEELVWLLYLTLLVASFSFTVGAWTRVSGLVVLLLHVLFHARNYSAYLGWGVMLKPYLFFVVMSSAGRYGSVDAWRRGAKSVSIRLEDWMGPAWPVRLLQIQLCTMYAVAGWSRLDDPVWLSGDIVLYAMDGRTFGRFDVDWFPLASPLRILGYVAFVLEPLAPFLLWVRGIGKWWALALISMHVTIELVTDVGWWQWMMIPLLTVFLPPDWLCALLRAPARWRTAAGVGRGHIKPSSR